VTQERDLGQKIRKLREGQGLSLKAVAAAAGVSVSFVSQVERGVANPSVGSLRRLADALGSSVGALFDGPQSVGRVVRAGERGRLIDPAHRWEDLLITPRDAKRLQVIESIIQPGQGSGAEPYTHDSDEECVIVLEGELEMGVGEETFLLNEGDSLLFESRIPHRNVNRGSSPARVLWITTPPSY
jgi:transcriptional regulator with XRE-family HTH domain